MPGTRTLTDYDLIIRNGLIIDGTGTDGFTGDVGIRQGIVAKVGQVDGSVAREIDAAGKIVTPGFVDVHTHYDGQAMWSNRLNPSSSHGVTTVVMGNCGVGFAPCRPADHDVLVKVMEGVEDIPGIVMTEGLDWTWETFPQFLDALEARPHDIDIAAYLPHSPLRVYVMGSRGARREVASSEDMAAMRRLAKEAVAAGALGFATSRVTAHRTSDGDLIPSYDASFAEIEAIASGMTEAGGGIVQVVPDATLGWSGALDPFIAIGRRTGRPITFTLPAINEPGQAPISWGDAKAILDKANADGVPIKGQVYPRPVGMILGLDISAHPFCLCPGYLAIRDLPLKERVARLREPALRAQILSEQPQAGHPLAQMARSFEWMFPMLDMPDYEPSLSQSIAAQARAKGIDPERLAYDMLLEKDGKALLWTALTNFPEGSLDEVGEMLRDDNVIVGLGDGGAHYGMICDSSYPTFMLTHWTRDRAGSHMTLPQAVRMLTAKPAAVVGLLDRGIIAQGYRADINVIDYDGLQLHGPEIVQDLPGQGRRLDQRATGFSYTIVGGEIIAQDGQPTEARPGRLIRGHRPVPAQVDSGLLMPEFG